MRSIPETHNKQIAQAAERTSGQDERTGIATPAVSLLEEAIHNPIPFIAKRFGSPGNALARLILLSRGRMFELGLPHGPGPVCD
jgi:hypothetical protein